MAKQNYSYEKRQREIEKKKKKELKLQKKMEKRRAPQDPDLNESEERVESEDM